MYIYIYIYIYQNILSPASFYDPTGVRREDLGNIMHLIPMPAGYTVSFWAPQLCLPLWHHTHRQIGKNDPDNSPTALKNSGISWLWVLTLELQCSRSRWVFMKLKPINQLCNCQHLQDGWRLPKTLSLPIFAWMLISTIWEHICAFTGLGKLITAFLFVAIKVLRDLCSEDSGKGMIQ